MNIPDNMTLQATVEQDDAKSGIDPQVWSERFGWLVRILILAALVVAPWMIGSVKYWSQFWLAAALMLSVAIWWFETALNKRKAQVVPYVSVFVFIGILIGLFQLVPLSGAFSDFFLGRQVELYEQFSQPDLTSESNEVCFQNFLEQYRYLAPPSSFGNRTDGVAVVLSLFPNTSRLNRFSVDDDDQWIGDFNFWHHPKVIDRWQESVLVHPFGVGGNAIWALCKPKQWCRLFTDVSGLRRRPFVHRHVGEKKSWTTANYQ